MLAANPSDFFDDRHAWCRFTRYELVKGGDTWYVTPAPDARAEIYKPFSQYPHLLLDYLQLVGVTGRWAGSKESAIEFCNKYGLLGQFWFNILRVKKSDKVRLFVDPDCIAGCERGQSGWLSYESYAREFFPTGSIPTWEESIAVLDEPSSPFLQRYSEPIEGFFVSIATAVSSSKYLRGVAKDVQAPRFGYVGIKTVPADWWLGNWAYRSLLDILSVMYLHFSNGPRKFRHPMGLQDCVACGQRYSGRRSDSKYCSNTCAARHRKRRQRERSETVR